MDELTYQTGPEPEITINGLCDLRIAGWDLNDVQVSIDGDEDNVRARQDGPRLWLELLDDATVRVPYGARLQLSGVAGDLTVQDVRGPLRAERVEGDMSARQCGPLEIGRVAGALSVKSLAGPLLIAAVDGDLAVRDVQGPLRAARVAGDLAARAINGPAELSRVDGDASLREINGPLQAERVAGDLKLVDIAGPINVQQVAGDADLNTAFAGPVRVVAAGDIACELAPGTDARFALHAAGGVRWLVPGAPAGRGRERELSLTLGSGSQPVELRADGRVIVRAAEGEWPAVETADFEAETETLGEDLARRIESEVEQKLRQLDDRLSQLDVHLGRHHEDLTRKVREKARQQGERARQRAERAAARAERRAAGRHAGRGALSWLPQPPVPPTSPMPPMPPRPPSEPVRDDERLAILRMVAEKKITPAEAEALLSALEG